jgi:phage FluMu protein Com
MEPPVLKGEMDERRRKDVPKLYIPSSINTQTNKSCTFNGFGLIGPSKQN